MACRVRVAAVVVLIISVNLTDITIARSDCHRASGAAFANQFVADLCGPNVLHISADRVVVRDVQVGRRGRRRVRRHS